jgi:hypothetical protein
MFNKYIKKMKFKSTFTYSLFACNNKKDNILNLISLFFILIFIYYGYKRNFNGNYLL